MKLLIHTQVLAVFCYGINPTTTSAFSSESTTTTNRRTPSCCTGSISSSSFRRGHDWTQTRGYSAGTTTTTTRRFTSLIETPDTTSDNDDDYVEDFASDYHAPVMWKECIHSLLSCQRAIPRHTSPVKQTSQDHEDDDDMNDSKTNDNESSPRRQKRKKKQQQKHVVPDQLTSLLPVNNNDNDDNKYDNNNKKTTHNLVFVDGTLGGGGDSQALLELLCPGDVVFGCDVDPAALQTASERLAPFAAAAAGCQNDEPKLPLFIPIQSNFCELTLERLLQAAEQAGGETIQQHVQSLLVKNNDDDDDEILDGVDGLLLDLGVSSHQIDTPERGFAYRQDGPLDMRMDAAVATTTTTTTSHLLTAADLCNELDVNELRRILQVHGDEPRAKSIAQSIVQHRPLQTTTDLQNAVAAVVPTYAKSRRMGLTATLARVFQSLRIVVNQEDIVLEKAMEVMAPSLIRKGGRLVVLSYHSMEDRATKRMMRDGTLDKRKAQQNQNSERDIYGNYIGTPKPFRTLGKKQKATEKEVEVNVRARSATLRVAERQ